ncbi:MAG: hypothetical protein ACC669_07235 [bacterium]
MKTVMNLFNSTLLRTTVAALTAVILLAGPTIATAGKVPVKLEQFLSDRLADTPDQVDAITLKLEQALDAGAAPEALTEIIHQSFERGLISVEIEEIFNVIIEAGEKNISTEPLTNKVLEGLAKKVDMEQLLFALDRTADRLVSANDLLKDLDRFGLSTDERDDLLSDTVAAMAAGVHENELRSVLTNLGRSGKMNDDLDPKDVVDLLQALVGYGIDSETAGSLTSRIIISEDLDSNDLHEIREAIYEEHREKSSAKELIATVEGYFDGNEDNDSEAYENKDEEGGSENDEGGEDEGGGDEGGEDEGGEED